MGDTTILQAYGATTEIFTWSGPAGLDSMTKASPRFVATTPGTFTWNVTGTSACTTATASVTIEVLPALPPITLGPDTTLCPGEQFFPGPESMPGLSYRWNTGATTSRINGSAAGKYWLTVTNGACSITDTVVVSHRGQTRPTRPWVASGSLVACQGDSVLLAAPFTNYSRWLWNNGATTSSTWVRQTGWYKLQISRADSCRSAWSDSLFIQFLPRFGPPQITPRDTIKACTGDTVRLRAFVTTGSEPAYNWTGGATGPELKVTRSGRYRVMGNYGSPCPTDSSAPVTVLFFGRPNQPRLLGRDTLYICPGDTLRLSAADINQISVTYRWSNGGRLPVTRVTQPGQYWLQTWFDSTCKSLPSRIITVLRRPEPQNRTLFGNRVICPGQGPTLYRARGTGVYNWNWALSQGGTIVQKNLGDSVLVQWPAQPGLYYIGAYPGDTNNCWQDSIGTLVRVAKQLEPAVPLGDSLPCLSAVTTFRVHPNDLYNGAVYNWEINGGTQLTGGTGPVISASFSGTGRIRYSISLAADSVCSGTSRWLPVVPKPAIPARPFFTDTTLCMGQNLTLRYTFPVNHSIDFDSGGATVVNRIIIWTATHNHASFELAFPTPGTYNIGIRETSESGCLGPRVGATVTILPRPATPPLPPYGVCAGQPLSIGAPANPALRYLWVPATYLSSDTVAQPVFLYNRMAGADTAIRYTQYVINRATGCQNEHLVGVEVYAPSARMAITDTTVCVGDSLLLGPLAVPTIFGFRWWPVQYLSDTISPAPTFRAPQVSGDTSITIYVRTTNQRQCVRLDTINIRVVGKPVLSFSGATEMCAGEGINLTGQGSFSYQWFEQRPGGWLPLGTGPQLNEPARNAGRADTTIIYRMTAGQPCPASIDIAIRVKPLPRPQIIYDNLLVCPQTGPLAYKVRGLPGSSFVWEVRGGAATANDTVVTVSWQQAPYALRVAENSAGGCLGQSPWLELTAPENPGAPNSGCDAELFALAIPNVITPNGDGYNDRLEIKNLRYYGNCPLTLTNRWGQVVYESSAYSNNFDGGELPAAVYFYQLSAGGRVYKGWLQVVR